MPSLRKFLEKINIEARIAFDEPMSLHTTFRIGGPAEAYVSPRSAESAAGLYSSAKIEGIPLTVVGGGANILVGDRGIPGIVLDTSLLESAAPVPDFMEEGNSVVYAAAAGLSIDRLCERTATLGLAGLESFYGMPGSVGGSVYMNARCYEVELKDRLESVLRCGADGVLKWESIQEEDWAYKKSPFQPGGPAADSLVLGARFRLSSGSRADLEAVMAEKRADREAKGHYRLPSAGSMFKNDRRLGRPTGRILDDLGFRGFRIGGAMVSEWHANIFVNAGGATARDMRSLIETVVAETERRAGIRLEPEVVALGLF